MRASLFFSLWIFCLPERVGFHHGTRMGFHRAKCDCSPSALYRGVGCTGTECWFAAIPLPPFLWLLWFLLCNKCSLYALFSHQVSVFTPCWQRQRECCFIGNELTFSKNKTRSTKKIFFIQISRIPASQFLQELGIAKASLPCVWEINANVESDKNMVGQILS